MDKKASATHEPMVQVHPRQQLQPYQEGEPQVTLEQIVELLRGQLVSLTKESSYKQLHNLKQHGSVEEYTKAFYQLVVQMDLNESEEQIVARFLSGLKPPIQDALSLHQLWIVSEAYNEALMFKKQLARRAFV
nr:hypothetical protein CFP56_40462 [Quercus suber]